MQNTKLQRRGVWGPLKDPGKFWVVAALWCNLRQFLTTFHVLANAFATFMSFLFNTLAQINKIFYEGLAKSGGGDKPYDVPPTLKSEGGHVPLIFKMGGGHHMVCPPTFLKPT